MAITLKNVIAVVRSVHGEPMSERMQREESARGGDGRWWWLVKDGWTVAKVRRAVSEHLKDPP